MKISETPLQSWYDWQKILFRFFVSFYLVFEGPWGLLYVIPGADHLLDYVYKGFDYIRNFFNDIFFHIPRATKPPNGNGDFPGQWMLVCTSLLFAIVGCIIWSIADRKRKNYNTFNYWFALGVRYLIISTCFLYGFIKVFCLQMPFPDLNELATPLGDLLPMRFSWLFIGYSSTYQIFSGAAELLAGMLLLFRRTATLGVLVATGVFVNVMMLNLSYDIPVKINSISLVVLCLYLLVNESPRLYSFFFKLQAKPSSIFVFPFETKKGRIVAISAKWLFVALALYTELSRDISYLNKFSQIKMPSPVTAGIYDVITQTKMGDTITVNMPDSVYWQNIVFGEEFIGSIKTTDSRFNQYYGRSYFRFKIDSTANLISLRKSSRDSTILAQFTYNIKDSVLVELHSYPRKDSMYLLLRRRIKPFPLSERPFHWVSETNR